MATTLLKIFIKSKGDFVSWIIPSYACTKNNQTKDQFKIASQINLSSSETAIFGALQTEKEIKKQDSEPIKVIRTVLLKSYDELKFSTLGGASASTSGMGILYSRCSTKAYSLLFLKAKLLVKKLSF